MLKRNKKKGFSLVELVVVIAVMAVLIAILAPALMSYVEKSRMQKDESAVSEVVNAVELALTDMDAFDEAYAHTVNGNYTGYADSNGQQIEDEVYWNATGERNKTMTITFYSENGTYDIGNGVINDMSLRDNSNIEKKSSSDEDILLQDLAYLYYETDDQGCEKRSKPPLTKIRQDFSSGYRY